MAYYRWQGMVRSAVAAAILTSVLDVQPPTPAQSGEVLTWSAHASPAVYHSLLQAVADIPVLVDEVLRLQGAHGCAYLAWRRVRAFYVREASTNLAMLQGRLRRLSPTQGEGMELFLNRCERLRKEYLQYGLESSDTELVVQVFTQLSLPWRQAVAQMGRAEPSGAPLASGQRALAGRTTPGGSLTLKCLTRSSPLVGRGVQDPRQVPLGTMRLGVYVLVPLPPSGRALPRLVPLRGTSRGRGQGYWGSQGPRYPRPCCPPTATVLM